MKLGQILQMCGFKIHSKIATFKWPFSKTLSRTKKARPTQNDAQFCQVHFTHGTIFGVRSESLLIRTILKRDRKMLHNTRKRE